MKTTQDIHILLNQIASDMGYQLLSITQYNDKSFQLDGYKEDSNELLYNSDDSIEQIDINDFPYLPVDEAIKMIQEYLAGKRLLKEPIEPIKKADTLADQARARLQANAILGAGSRDSKDKFSNL